MAKGKNGKTKYSALHVFSHPQPLEEKIGSAVKVASRFYSLSRGKVGGLVIKPMGRSPPPPLPPILENLVDRTSPPSTPKANVEDDDNLGFYDTTSLIGVKKIVPTKCKMSTTPANEGMGENSKTNNISPPPRRPYVSLFRSNRLPSKGMIFYYTEPVDGNVVLDPDVDFTPRLKSGEFALLDALRGDSRVQKRCLISRIHGVWSARKKPVLESEVNIKGGGAFLQRVSYENFSDYCFHCKKFGHAWNGCKILEEVEKGDKEVGGPRGGDDSNVRNEVVGEALVGLGDKEAPCVPIVEVLAGNGENGDGKGKESVLAQTNPNPLPGSP
ncbi:hypothetical protein LIER_02781 [Lithospermum erythrorhizon]|uniref:DUF4283 domain-containing protein n=1 Tax=Lithospermum erythrorhizon TaxID=34254 RepID=A0AAV3NQQ5_LITER